MMSTVKLDQLILRNLADLDATAQRIDQIDEKVWAAVERVIARWASSNGWIGMFDIAGRGVWVSPASWQQPKKDQKDADASFWFEIATHDPPTHFDLSDLCGVGGSRYGLRFHQKVMDNAEWKDLARSHSSIFAELGMRLDSKASPFMEVVVAPELLIAAVETGDFDVALTPIIDGLDRLLPAEASLGGLLFKPRKSPVRGRPVRRKPTSARP